MAVGSKSDLNGLLETVGQLVRVGVVVSTNFAAATARVQFGDADDLVSYDMQIVFPKTSKDKFYNMPDTGDQVVCLFLPNGLEQGFILGSVYSTVDVPPVQSPDKDHITYSDGTVIEYDRAAHVLTANVQGTATIQSTGLLTIKAPSIALTGTVTVNGDLSTTGNSYAKTRTGGHPP
jgi:phage baseplate assembly protein V